jgi:hypothetical protein
MCYIFSFWVYRQILFNEQLKIALNLYSTDEDFREKIKQKVRIRLAELAHALKQMEEGKTEGKANVAFWGAKLKVKIKYAKGEDLPLDTLGQEIRKQLDLEASRAVTSVYGVSLSAYFPILIFLELVVILGFVIPLYELMSTGYIGVFNLSLWPGTVTVNSWVVEWAFFGAFVHSFFNMMDRVPRKDIRPSFYLNILIRYIIAVALASIFYLGYDLFIPITNGASAVPMALLGGIAFIIGMFPNVFLRTIEDVFASKIKFSLSADEPLTSLPGISRMEASRLWEEGIHNINQLADSNVSDLHKRTHYNLERLSTIIGSALLWRVVGGNKPVSLENKKQTTRIEVLRLLGINTIQQLYSFLFESNAHAKSNEAVPKLQNEKGLDLLVQKLGLEKEFILNAALSRPEFEERVRVPPSAVKSLVS